jgi:hypothetical protein
MADNYLVIRIHPDSPVDGATFSTYLDGLQIRVYLAGSGTLPSGSDPGTATLLGETKINSTTLTLTAVPWAADTYLATVSKRVATPTKASGSNFGTTLDVPLGDGIAFGSVVVCPADPKAFADNTTVSTIPIPPASKPTTLTLNQSIQKFVAADTLVTFYFAYGPGSSDSNAPTITPTWTGSDPSFQFDVKVKGKVTNSKTVKFDHSDGIAVGMTMTSGSGVPAGTTVAAVPDGTSITLSNKVSLADGATVTFESNLDSGIIQHVEPVGQFSLFGVQYVPVPASIATAIIPFTTAVPSGNSYLDVTVLATRNGVAIPIDNDFYDVIVSSGTPTPDQYQTQPQESTSLYLTLPAPPNPNAIDLIVPTDGTAPSFDALHLAMKAALSNDAFFAGKTLDNLSPADCSRMAYDIIWSQQGNVLPIPPDALESLYTNPPNPGGSNDNGNTNNLEQDRQKFEGTVNSFYATRNATAERLTKFVAAASGALVCENRSLNSTTALLEFPVDPESTFAASVESELRLEGLGTNGVSGLVFGVPAAFFYALGSGLDKSTTSTQRFQLATGDTIERLLQVFSAAELAKSITDTEDFNPPSATLGTVTSFQAARRLSALGVSAASNGPSVPVYAGTPLAQLVADWLSQVAPPASNPPLTYENTDFNVWSGTLAGLQPTGYLFLDLETLTQGYLIPPFTARPSETTSSGLSTLTFVGTAIGIGVGMPVTGNDIAADTTVTKVETITTVVISNALTGTGVTTTTPITFNAGASPIVATTNVDIGAGTQLTFAGASSAEGISAKMTVAGTNIPNGTTVLSSVTKTTVTLSNAVTGDVDKTDVLTFNYATTPLTAKTSADVSAGKVLTFASTTGIERDMFVSGLNIPPGTTVQSVAPTTVTLNGPVLGDVPVGTLIVFPQATTYLSNLQTVTASTTADAPAGKTLSFASTSGILPGMSVFGTGIGPDTTLSSVSATSVTLDNAVAADVPDASVISFVPLASSLADQIAAWLPTTTTPPTPSPTVETLKRVTAAQWTNFFTYTGNPTWLPPFTQPVAPGASPGPATQKPGYVAARIRAFIRAVQQFFSVSSVATSAQLPAIGAPPLFDLAAPSDDPILEAVGYLSTITGSTFTFGSTISPSDLATAVQDVFPDDPAARAWLTQALIAINELFIVASAVSELGVPLPNPVSLRFSIAEALYARGFRRASDISRLSGPDFKQALTGTIAYDYATLLQTKAQSVAPMSAPGGSADGTGFQAINPDGSLTNCVPPECLSPTGPIAYLHELLKLSQSSTCENPFAAPTTTGQSTLGDAVSARRGPVGNLLATCANLETPLPAIDIVNECLEYLGTAPATASGTVYDTSADALAGFALCDDDDCKKQDRDCHDPTAIFAALPEYSTPAAPVAKNQAVEPLVYNNLKTDFSSCDLPYSQALDVSRTYLEHFGSCRFEEMRTFRKCITEFALDPVNPPVGFQSFLRRYPVRIDTAIEYFGITPEEYTMLFQGSIPQACGQQTDDARPRSAGPASATEIFGFSPVQAREISDSGVIGLPEFLAVTCLNYCEFVELSKSGVPITLVGPKGNATAADRTPTSVPECEPCCPGDYQVQLPGESRQTALLELVVFVRLWRKLKGQCGGGYTFAQLADICTVLKLIDGSSLNPDFIRQLAAFQMLRDQFELPLSDPDAEVPGATGADRTFLLALWVGSSARKWNWAKHHLLEGIEAHARSRYGCPRERDEQIAHMADNLDALSRLAGFDPPTTTTPSTDVWNSNPACTLRFAEVLAKMCASEFRIGELLYLFNAEPPEQCETPFPIEEADEALAHPLDVPDEGGHHSLWKLREELLRVEVGDDECRDVTWSRVVADFRNHFGYSPPAGQDPLLSLGQHFFPCALEESGFSVSGKQRQYRTTLASTTSWNSPLGSPFQYDASASELWVQLPLSDEAVAAKLGQLPQLNDAEQAAVQDLYFAPRLDLSFVAFLFPDWQSAEIHLIQECDEQKRWHWFRRHLELANARRRVIAEHLARHVAQRTGCRAEDLPSVAGLVMSRLASDENTGSPWDSDLGTPPTPTWAPPPVGGAIPALLGLVGTGLLGEYQFSNTTGKGAADKTQQLIWRDVRGPMEAFGHERDATNSPVPTVLPPLALSNATNPLVTVTNGYATRVGDGRRLGGAAPTRVRWSGVLLVEREGEYRFRAGAPTHEGEPPDFERAEKSQWRVTLQRGSRTVAVLNHDWPGNTEPEVREPRLRRGAYQIVVEYSQPAPDFSAAAGHPHHARTGFQVKYAGPDSDDVLVTLPVRRLYRDYQDTTLDRGVTFLKGSKNAQAFLKSFYTSTLRDIRRTYQRAFKALLFAGKLDLSARRERAEHHQSELGYMLANPVKFAGYAYYRTSSTAFTQHLVNFDFDFLPVVDTYHPPAPDGRSAPSRQQTSAMFDWWERLFDYTVVRQQARRRGKVPLWNIFEEALVDPPGDSAQLLRHIGAEPRYWDLDLRYYQDQTTAIYAVSDADLQDDRWLVRVWHADQWVRCLMDRFHAKDISKARPDLWASDDPSAPVLLSGVNATGNANLLAFVDDGCFDEQPRRYGNVKRLNDGLRERGRNALLSYLCSANRVLLPWTPATYATKPGDLSELLLLDVEAGICERASRIEEAITAVQTFVRRSRLGLEPNWIVDREFTRLWDSRFETYRTWEKSKLREIYRENWIEWTEREKARRIEAFRFLESELRSSTLTLAAPGGLDWWQDDVKQLEQAPRLLQQRIPSELEALTAPPQSTTREGLATLGSPEYAAQPTWLAAVPESSASTQGGSGSTGGGSTDGGSTGGGSTGGVLTEGGAGATRNPSAAATAVPAFARAAANGDDQSVSLPFWMESAMKLGTRFLRVAAAAVPQASLGFEPRHDEPRSTCCSECGGEHPVLVDEYYFWLTDTEFYTYTDQTDAQSNPDISFTGSYQFGFQDSYYDPYQQQSAEWQEEDQVPSLLAKWEPNRGVRLAWCRVHNGQFGQPRKSNDYVAISSPADLVFVGRGGDSLYFEVTGSADVPPGYSADPSPAGFRYDLASDESVGTPQAIKPPALPTPSPFPGGLLSYPFFAYHDAGARLFPKSWFSPAMAVAETLRANCRFELALDWYKRAFDPLNRDCTWMVCDGDPAGVDTGNTGNTGNTGDPANPGNPASPAATNSPAPTAINPQRGREGNSNSACCDTTKITNTVARDRAVVLEYCQTLMEWGDALMRRRRSPEAFQQARLVYDTVAKITGRIPQTILTPEPASPSKVADFTPANPPLNPRLMDLYSLVDDRLGLIRTCYDARRLRDGRRDGDMAYWGDDPLRDGWRMVRESCADETEWCDRSSPYRFVFQIQKALEIAGRVRELGAALLAAYEKGDAEALASIRADQERDMLTLGISIRQDQWRDADWQVQALQQTKDVNQTNLLYYATMYQNGLINNEIQNLNLSTNSMQTRTGANIAGAIGEVFHVVPDSFVGAMSSFVQIPIGTKLAGLFDTISKIMQTVADIQSATASMDLTQAGWQRRSVEWFHQMQTLPIEIHQIELQILGAQRRRDQAMQELNNQQRQIENASEVLDFLRDKFTATDQYLFLRKETSAQHRLMYDMAHRAADQAQRAFNFERGHTTRRFIQEDTWDSLHDGLMAGERLDLALRRMQKEYLDLNAREYELTKHFSLRCHFPMEFLRIKETGRCEIELPEWMFDLDYPGQYMRRIKNVTLTIPCVTGPYTGVHCRATLLSSVTRIDPRLDLPASSCCCECGTGNGYDACAHDVRLVRSYAAREAIATSTGQNDAGLFALDFRDDRYLPFEFQGAVSRWRIELPAENNYFDMDTLSDVIINLNYTSREGGGALRRAAMDAARKRLPGDGWCFFDVRHEFPDAWQMLRNSSRENGYDARLGLHLERKMFPFVPDSAEVSVTRIAVLFHAHGRECDCPKPGDCHCQREHEADCRLVGFSSGDHRRDDGTTRVACVRTDEWPDLYYGVFETALGPVGRRGAHPGIAFTFPRDAGEVESMYLLCQYRSADSGGERRSRTAAAKDGR